MLGIDTGARYKGKTIKLDSLYFCATYEGVYALSEKHLPAFNRKILQERIPEDIGRLWGQRRYHIIGSDMLDLQKPLPPLVVFAWFESEAVIKDNSKGGAHLFLVWFQERESSPFDKAVQIVNEIDWEDEATDYGF